jgi:hypothetical protein
MLGLTVHYVSDCIGFVMSSAHMFVSYQICLPLSDVWSFYYHHLEIFLFLLLSLPATHASTPIACPDSHAVYPVAHLPVTCCHIIPLFHCPIACFVLPIAARPYVAAIVTGI